MTKITTVAPTSPASSIMRGPDLGVGVVVGVEPPGVVVAAFGAVPLVSGDCHDSAAKMPATINNSSSRILANTSTRRRFLGLRPPPPPPRPLPMMGGMGGVGAMD